MPPEAPPTRTRGRKKKTASASINTSASSGSHVDADATPGASSTPPDEPTAKRRKAPTSVTERFASAAMFAQVSRAPDSFKPKACARAPNSAYSDYREMVDTRAVGFFQIDPRTWVAELFDVDTQRRNFGVKAWTVVRCHTHLDGRFDYTCSPCPDFNKHNSCVHVLVLESTDPPQFKPFSQRGKSALEAEVRR